MKKQLVSIAMLLPILVFGAGRSDTGYIRDVHYMSNGAVIFSSTGARTGTPGCASSQPTRWAIPASTPQGKVQLAGLLSAYHANKPVIVLGTGDCSVWSDTESVNYFHTVE